MELKENSQMILDDVMIRYEIVKISAQRTATTKGVEDILFDSKVLLDFIKNGKMPEPDTEGLG